MTTHAEHLMALFSKAYSRQDDSRRGDTNIHASNLINFCPRTYMLCKTHDRGYHGNRYIGMDLGWTFDMGYAVQKIQVKRLMTQQALFGTWECRHCGYKEVGLQKDRHPCPKCKCRAWQFQDLAVELKIPYKDKKKKLHHIAVRGHIDYVVALSENRGFVTDAKSIKAEDFDKIVHEASIDYQRQVQIYMWMPNTKGGQILGNARDEKQLADFKIDPDNAVVCYGVKGSRQVPIKPILVQQNPVFIKSIEKKLQALAQALSEEVVPERICKSQADMMAKACVCRDICFEQTFTKRVLTLA